MIGAMLILMMCCCVNSQAISKKQLELLNSKLGGYTLMPFGKNLAAVKDTAGKYGLIDRNGDWCRPTEFDSVSISSEYIQLFKRGKSILLGDDGLLLIDSTQYAEVRLDGNHVKVVTHAGKHGYYGSGFTIVLPNNYSASDYVFYPLPGGDCIFALKNEEGKWALRYPKTGWMSEYIYEKAPEPAGGHYLHVYMQGLYSVFDCLSLKELVPYGEKVDSCSFWNNDVSFLVSLNPKDSLHYIYNAARKSVAVKPNTEFCYWKNKYVVVSKGGEERNKPLMMLNRIGKQVHILKVTDELCWQYRKEAWTFKMTSGKRLAGPFDEFDFLSQGDEETLFIVGNGGKYGVVNMKGKEIIPTEYAAVQFYHNGNIKVFVEYEPNDSTHTKNKFKFYTRKGKQMKGDVLSFDPFVDSCGSRKSEAETLECQWFRNMDGKFGLCRLSDMKVLVPFVCDTYGSLFSNGMAVAVYQGRCYYVNEKGQGLPPEVYGKK